MKEYIEREAAIFEFETNGSNFVYGKKACNAIISRLKTIPAADVVEYEEVENLLRWAVLHDWTWEEAQEHLQRLRAKMDGGADK